MENRAFYLTDLQTMKLGTAPMPVYGDDDVLIKIKSVGICGSDLHYFKTGYIGKCIVNFPFILGHEAAGEVVEVGKNVKTLKIGDRVCMEPGIPCFHCEDCLSGRYNLCKEVRFWATPPYDGTLCDYVAHPAAFTYKIPDNMSYSDGALVEPLAIGIHAANTTGIKLGNTVAILGTGCIGLVSILAAKAYGATTIIAGDIIDKRLEKAAEVGALTINTAKDNFVDFVMKQTNGKGADVVLDCAGYSETMLSAIECAANMGTIGLIGLGSEVLNGLPIDPISCKELTIKSIFRYRNLYPTAIKAIADKRINIGTIVSHRFKFEQSDIAFSTCLKEINDVVKGIIDFY